MTPDPMIEIRKKLLKHKADMPPHTKEMDEHMVLLRALCDNAVVAAAFNEAVAQAHPYTEAGEENPWRYASVDDFHLYFDSWFTDLPSPSGGIGFIFPFAWFYNENHSGYYFLNDFKSKVVSKMHTKEIFNWILQFILIRGRFMDSKQSLPADLYEEWANDPITHIDDFLVPPDGFQSFNDFFTRELKITADSNPRPIASPDDDSVVIASADTIINFILSDLTLETDIHVKGRQIAMKKMLDGSDFASHFVGGTAVSCVLMPNVYHHYHAPVSGSIVESKDVPGIYNGVMDGEHWFNDMSNPGQANTDFSAFEDFHRAYYIIDAGKYGHVAVIPVGLNTISRIRPSLQGDEKYYVQPGGKPVPVKKGDKLGNFAYGGSLNILMFEKGVFPCVSLLMGCRLGEMYPKVTDDDNEVEAAMKSLRPAVVQFLGGLKKAISGRRGFF